MQPIKSIVNPQDNTYQVNYAANSSAVERLKAELARSTKGGGEQYVKRHLARGRLLPRERIEMLLDEGSYFLEIAPLAGIGIENEFVGAGVVGGIGLVSGRECLIIANEATVKGGAVSEIGQLKNRRLSDVGTENRLLGGFHEAYAGQTVLGADVGKPAILELTDFADGSAFHDSLVGDDDALAP